MDYIFHLLILIGLYLILAQSFNLTFGLGRLFNLAHVAAYSIGAYSVALLATERQWGFFACIASGMIFSAFFSLLIGAISSRLKNDYFAIATLAFSALINALLVNWKELTRGVLGIPGIPRPELALLDFSQNAEFLLLMIGCVLLTFIPLHLIFSGGAGRMLRAQAEHEHAALALGIDATLLRRNTFMIASAYAGLAGGLFAYYLNYIDPSSFAFNEMIFLMSIVVVGRPGSFWGVALATIFLVLLPEPLRFLDLPPGILGPMRQFLYGLILFLFVFWKRAILFPLERTV